MKERINQIIEAYTEKKKFFYGAASQTEKQSKLAKPHARQNETNSRHSAK